MKNEGEHEQAVGSRPAEVVDLRRRLGEQAAEIAELRRTVGWLTDDLAVESAELESTMLELAVDGPISRDDPRIVHRRTIQRFRRFVGEHVARGGQVVVATEGDEAMLRHAGLRAEHLSRDRVGGYAGSMPESSRAAVVQLEAARWRGADTLILPASALWWLQHFEQFSRHLQRRYTLLVHDEALGAVWDLRQPSPWREVDDLLADLRFAGARQPVVLDWHTGCDLETRLEECKVFSPHGKEGKLPYLDGTIDVVAVAGDDPERMAEARRVAAALVLDVKGSSAAPLPRVLWRSAPVAGALTDVSIIVARTNRRPSFPRFLQHFHDTLPPSFAGEVIAADEDPLARTSGGKTFSAAVRRAAEEASSDVVVVLDTSTRPLGGWLPPLVHVLRHVRGAGAVFATMLEPDGRPLSDSSDGAAGDPHVRRLDVVRGGLFATHRPLLLECGPGASEAGNAAELLSAHAWSRGLSVLLQPETLAIASWADETLPATAWKEADLA